MMDSSMSRDVISIFIGDPLQCTGARVKRVKIRVISDEKHTYQWNLILQI
jgi:hypothetical protein